MTGKGEAATLIILENDLYRRLPAKLVDGFLGSAAQVVVLDHLANGTTAKATLLLPAATFAESDGTLVSNEGRAQRFFPVFAHPGSGERDEPHGDGRESWRWLGDPAWSSLDDVLTALQEEIPQLAPAAKAAPLSKFRIAGAKIPREPHRYSGLTSMTANISVVEPKPPADPDSALAYSMEGASVPAAKCAAALLLVARLEFHSVGEQISKRDWRCAARRRCRHPFVRAVTGGSILHRRPACLCAPRCRNG